MGKTLDAATLERFKTRLEARRLEIETTIARSSDQTTAVKPDSAIGRLTRVDAVQAGYVSDALKREMRAELARIERALRSIDEGTFGICGNCGEALSVARLEANLCIVRFEPRAVASPRSPRNCRGTSQDRASGANSSQVGRSRMAGSDGTAILEKPVSDRGRLEDLSQSPRSPFKHDYKLLILNGEMSEWLKEHAWKLLWRSATVCYRFRLPLRSQPLNGDCVTSVDRRKPQ